MAILDVIQPSPWASRPSAQWGLSFAHGCGSDPSMQAFWCVSAQRVATNSTECSLDIFILGTWESGAKILNIDESLRKFILGAAARQVIRFFTRLRSCERSLIRIVIPCNHKIMVRFLNNHHDLIVNHELFRSFDLPWVYDTIKLWSVQLLGSLFIWLSYKLVYVILITSQTLLFSNFN